MGIVSPAGLIASQDSTMRRRGPEDQGGWLPAGADALRGVSGVRGVRGVSGVIEGIFAALGAQRERVRAGRPSQRR